jgi:hypothetical protein
MADSAVYPDPDHTDFLYDVYREKYRILEWRAGAVYKTESLGVGWFPMEDVDRNVPAVTGVIYAAADDEFARENMTIRTRKGPVDE